MQQVKVTKDKPRKVYLRQHLDSDGDGHRNVKHVTNAAMMLHGDRKFATYFFSTVCGALNGNCVGAAELHIQDGVITGSDEESALLSALRTANVQPPHHVTVALERHDG